MSRYRESHTIYIIVYNLKQNMQIYHILFNDNFFFIFLFQRHTKSLKTMKNLDIHILWHRECLDYFFFTHMLNMLKIKRDVNRQDFELHFVKSEYFLWIASARHNFKWTKIPIT